MSKRDFFVKTLSEINFNNEKLSFKEPEFLEDNYYKNSNILKNKKILWKKNVYFHLTNNAVVSGFVALRKKGSVEESGLSLFRRKRLIEDRKVFENENDLEKHISFIEKEIQVTVKEKKMLELKNWLKELN